MRHGILLILALAACGIGDDGDDGDDTDVDGPEDDALQLTGFTGRTFDSAELAGVTLATGDVVRHGAASVLVPDPGEGVTAEALRVDGRADTLTVDVDDDGHVSVITDEPAAVDPRTLDPGADAAFAGGPCHDRRFNVEAHNNCGRGDHVGAEIYYLGRTRRGTNVTAHATCGHRDGHSVVGFRDFDGLTDLLADTCTWKRKSFFGGRKEAVESDIRISRTDYSWWVSGECDEFVDVFTYSLEAVMTHELGHSFGLAHVDNTFLTMSPTVDACKRGSATLGLGDMLGLETLY